jgi:hypothetical protein
MSTGRLRASYDRRDAVRQAPDISRRSRQPRAPRIPPSGTGATPGAGPGYVRPVHVTAPVIGRDCCSATRPRRRAGQLVPKRQRHRAPCPGTATVGNPAGGTLTSPRTSRWDPLGEQPTRGARWASVDLQSVGRGAFLRPAMVSTRRPNGAICARSGCRYRRCLRMLRNTSRNTMPTIWPPRMIRLTSMAGCHRTVSPSTM